MIQTRYRINMVILPGGFLMHNNQSQNVQIIVDFLRAVKKNSISMMMRWGRKHPLLKYPVFLFTALFIFIYNIFLHLFIRWHMKEKLARALAFAMSIILVFTSVDLTAFAAIGASQSGSRTILSVESLSADLTEQTIYVGDTADRIQLPASLEVSVLTEKAAESSSAVETGTASDSQEKSLQPTSEQTTPASSAAPESGTSSSKESVPVKETAPAKESVPVKETTPAKESALAKADQADGFLSGLADRFMPALEVSAAEAGQATVYTEKLSVPVTWSLDTQKSSSAQFSSETAGAVFVYQAALPDGYILAEGVTIPQITVRIAEQLKTITDTQISLTAPVAGQTGEASYTDAGGQYKAAIKWYQQTAELSEQAVFEAGILYTARLTVTPSTGYTLNGLPQDAFHVTDQAGKEYPAAYDPAGHVITVAFDVTAAEEPFEQSTIIDGIRITVTADAGVFPDGAVMKAARIADKTRLNSLTDSVEQIESGDISGNDPVTVATVSGNDPAGPAVSDNDPAVTDDSGNVVHYAFDISIYNAAGEMIEPNEEKGQVKVAFSNPDPEKWGLEDLTIYHVNRDSGEVNALNTQADAAGQSVEAVTPGFSEFDLYAVSPVVTLYAGMGKLNSAEWTSIGNYTYQADSPQSFPTPTSADGTLSFSGWFTDSSYSSRATTPSAGGTYYAKWSRTANAAAGSAMNYNFKTYGVDAHGLIGGSDVTTTHRDKGYRTYYKYSNPYATNGGKTLYPALSGSDVFQKVAEVPGLYVATTASFEGAFVRYSYYLWNRGTTNADYFNLGVAADVQIGDNDRASLTLSSDRGGSYVNMVDGSREFRLYYAGGKVTPTDTLWTGRFIEYEANVFNDNRVDQNDVDATLAFSWKNISIPANSVVVKSVLLGCGTAGSLSLNRTYSYEKNGDGVFDEVGDLNTDVVTAPAAPVRSGYYFLGWNTEADGSGTGYQPGNSISVGSQDLKLYSMWKQIENTAIVTLKRDHTGWDGQSVQLCQNGTVRYTLGTTGTAGSYRSDKVLNGTYDIYVNHRKTDKSLTFQATSKNIALSQEVAYTSISVTTTIDGAASSEPGTVTLRRGSSVIYTLSGTNGSYSDYLRESEGTYQIYVGGVDTGFTMDTANPEQTIAYDRLRIQITDDTAWTNAGVVLRDSSGNLAAAFAATATSGNTVTYTKVMQEKEDTYTVWVNGHDTHKTIAAAAGKTQASVSYYTSHITIKGSVPSPAISMTNRTESYQFSDMTEKSQTEHLYTREHVLQNYGTDGTEKSYLVTVAGTVDTIPVSVSSQVKDAVLQYWKVSYYNSDKNNPDILLQTVYVRDTCVIAAYQKIPSRSGYSFGCWSTTRWTDTLTTSGPAFDFSKGITADTTLYANYEKPTVLINGLVYTDASGTIGGNGQYYRMANLTLKGFDPGETSIKYLFLTLTNAANVKLLDTSNMSIKSGAASVTAGGNITITPTADKIAITFNSAISMARAQEYLRNKVIVQAKSGTNSITVEAMDGAGSYRAVNSVTSGQTTDTMTQITSSWPWYTSLTSGHYYVSGTVTITRGTGTGQNGLSIESGAVVYIHVLSGAVLRVTGAAASGAAHAGAGIYVPSNATLYLLGKGTVYATGGKGGDGTSGADGYRAYDKLNGYNWSGAGGAGGTGGGGAGYHNKGYHIDCFCTGRICRILWVIFWQRRG